ncbi:MAG: YlbF family regulator [bacterium]
MNSDIKNLIENFGEQLIEAIPEFKDLQFAFAELNNDIKSRQLLDEINTRKDTIAILKSQNLPVSQVQNDELALLMSKMRENEWIMKYLRSRNLARKKAVEIGNSLESIVGVDFAPGKVCQ